MRSGTLSCEPAQGRTGGARGTIATVGGQHHYVRLANSGNVLDPVAGTFATTVTVQNLLLAALGTADGATAHATGVRVFFASGPTNGVTVANATGQESFLSPNQDYFQYSGADLGADGILGSDETSAGKQWAFNTGGADGFAFSVYVQAQVPTGADYTAHFTQVVVGGAHTCALSAAAKAYCWGSDGNGQLGDGSGTAVLLGVPSAVQMPEGVSFTSISAGANYTCALGTDGRAYCWGSDNTGRLGNGTTLTAAQYTPSLVNMPTGVSFTSISAGSGHACALGSDSRAYCWGTDNNGRLGNGDALTAEQHSPSPVEMPAGVSFTSISAGTVHTCALGSNSRAYCWGTDTNGRLGNGSTLTADQSSPSAVQMPAGVSATSISAGETHTCALGSDSRSYCWGADTNGRLGNGATLTAFQQSPSPVQMPAGVSFTSISAGTAHTCALASDSRAYCWGSDGNGRLGNGGTLTADQQSPSPVQMPAGVSFSSLSAASPHACALTDGPGYCWGSNGSRQAGDGTAIVRDAPAVIAASR
ncbi:MAG TPA: hypothetical protein VF665_15220 [Longimicrobium sp.]|uniref:RCC1 domain-containing protein n=1 Tax=Longimicrobium sp. TaxID=2029185 RepID=UPI002ED7EC35